jgi:Putative MetA-pathway of phenol degradation
MQLYQAILFLFTVLVACTVGYAQLDNPSPLKANRPGISESPGLVIPGALQVESGHTLRKNKSGAIETFNYTYNTVTLRYGVNEHFEFRLRNDYLGTREKIPSNNIDNTINGFGPFSFGASIKLSDQKGIVPDAYFIPTIKLRTGTSEFRPTYTSSDLVLTLGHALTEKLYMTNHIGETWNGQSPDAIFAYILCFDIVLSKRASCFVESYNYFPEDSGAEYNWDAGFYYRITPLIQLDVSVGTGLFKDAEDIFLDGGITARFFR